MRWFLALLLALVSFPAMAAPPANLDEIVSSLRKGGCVLFMRHTHTHSDQKDTDLKNLDNIKAQRQLTENGRLQARALGISFRKLGIPVGKIVASRLQRALDTARLLALCEVEPSDSVTLEEDKPERRKKAEVLLGLLSSPPPAGENTIIVSHLQNLMDCQGNAFITLEEGGVVVFKPLSNGTLTTVGVIESPLPWIKLAR